MFTHVNMDALAGGEFFTRLAHKIVHSEKQIEKVEDLYNLMEKSIDEMEGYRKNFCKQQLQKGHSKYKEATNPDMPLSKVNMYRITENLKRLAEPSLKKIRLKPANFSNLNVKLVHLTINSFSFLPSR